MIGWRRWLPFPLLSLIVLGSGAGLCGETEEGSSSSAPGQWYFSKFNGTTDRHWVPEVPVDPADLHAQGMHHGMVMYEVTQYPDAEPTPEQVKAAESLVKRSFEAAKKHGWFNFSKALEDGFHVWGRDPTHFRNDDNVLDDRVLDPDRPEFLIYEDTEEDGRKLAGFMYQASTVDQRGPQVGGPLTIWHYHIFVFPQCVEKGVMWVAYASDDGTCPAGKPAYKSAEMMHVWFLDRPDGPFATVMTLTPEQRTQLGNRED